MQIGVYHRQGSPTDVIAAGRLQAMIEESAKQGVQLLFFHDGGVSEHGVSGLRFANGEWTEASSPLPEVVMNLSPLPPGQQSRTYRELMYRTVFTTHLIHGKHAVYQKLLAAPDFAHLVMPVKRLANSLAIGQLLAMLDEHDEIVLKPDFGRQGAGIVRLAKSKGLYQWQDAEDAIVFTAEQLERRVRSLVEAEPYIVQPYQRCLTRLGEPFDFRVHVQRDGTGQWSVTRVYPRIGVEGGVVSNVSAGGRQEELEFFLRTEFPDNAPFLGLYLERLGLRIAEYLSDCYENPLDELGIDLSIDASRRTWFYEANTSPASSRHESARAAKAIAYAKYLALEERSLADEPLQTKSDAPVIGMLAGTDIDMSFVEACASVAKLYGAEFFYFHPKNVNAENHYIRARVFENGAWKKRTCPYPDVVFDKFKRRGFPEYEYVYEALSSIPFTHGLQGGSMRKEFVYGWLESHSLLRQIVIPYLPVEKPSEMAAFVDTHLRVIIKPAQGSFGQSIIMIRKREDDYELFDQKFLHYLKPDEFQAFLRMFAGRGYVAQRYVYSTTKEDYPFHLRVHLMKNGAGEWVVVFIQPFLSLSYIHQVTNHENTLRLASKWIWFLSSQYQEELGMEMDRKVRTTALMAASYLSTKLSGACHEIALDIGVDQSRKLWLFEANFNKIGNTFHGFEAARLAIPYALSLVNRNLKAKQPLAQP
ncbi:YheC/YheD family protein [Paenibacillus soyae]|uniref:YheC/YheD family protein n=1 Tax=Paenibacillus soyae TaxID=2969249 RepID=A0A9X2N0J8_9BACL|nr:YheC/YheD family protein [Paenibacillus soyae]MCR2806892.1 YheC/YheD family protein [Paenibacillus soyae]